MALINDLHVLNNCSTADWNVTNFDQPGLDDSASPTPFYLEGTADFYWWLKKGQTGDTNQSTSGVTGGMGDRILVAFANYPFAEIAAVPITTFDLQIGSTSFTSNYITWDGLDQIAQPYNLPISGHTPIMAYPTTATETGTFSTTATTLYYGWNAVTGNNADGKQGGFSWFFLIGYLGAHSATHTEDYFSDLYYDAYDSTGGGLPGTTSRPLGVLSKSGNNYTSNARFQFGDGSADTSNIVVTETGKSIFFNNIATEHELGYIFVDPNSTHEIRLTLESCNHSWNDQESTAEIFRDVENATYFKITSCGFTNGGIFESPPDTANRWIRSSTFSNCKTGVISDGEFTNNTVTGCDTVSVSGDADLTGTKILLPAVAADESGLEWNGNYDPNGNLDDMEFSKGTAAHHAIGFGTSAPPTMTLTGIAFSGFNATDGQNDSTLHFPDKGTDTDWTINNSGCTGNLSYKKVRAGDTVTIVSSVDIDITVKDTDGVAVSGAVVGVYNNSTRVEILNDTTDINGEIAGAYGGTTPLEVEVRVRKASGGATKYINYSSVQTIAAGTGLALSVTLQEDPNNNATA